MKLINLQSLGHALLIIGAFAFAGSVTAEKSEALPVVTANSTEFKNDWTLSGGLDAISKERKTVIPGSIGVFSYRADSPRFVGDTTITAPTMDTHGTYGYAANAKRTASDSVIRPAVASGTKTDRPFQGEGYLKGSARLGSDATVGAVYYHDAIAPEMAIRNGNLAAAIGYQFGDRASATGSIAYSIGKLSPFASYRDKAIHYGAEYQVGDNLAVQGAYRPDGNQYSIGLNIGLGSSGTKVATKPACEDGYGYNANFGGCAKKFSAPVRQPVTTPPNVNVIRGRG